MRFGLVFDELFEAHDTGFGHPERAARVAALKPLLEEFIRQGAVRIPVKSLPLEVLLSNHSADYVSRVREACLAGEDSLDSPDCALSPRTFEVACAAAGSVICAAQMILDGTLTRAFCAVRPPGHHAEFNHATGFCYFNNVALAARHVLRSGIERLAIIDWDVHHGNGTQHSFEDSSQVLFVSLHGHPRTLYPGSGFEHETGKGEGIGFTLNVPLPPGTTDAAYRELFSNLVIPKLETFQPQFVIISAGFDAHVDDPLGNQNLKDETFGWLTESVCGVADRFADGRVLSVLEGGYDLDALARSVQMHLTALWPTAE